MHARIIPGNAPPPAGANADTAAYTFICKPVEIRLGAYAFGVVAPCAGKVTAFKKHGGSQAGAVLGGHALYIKYYRIKLRFMFDPGFMVSVHVKICRGFPDQ
jgi:hypothetical protein